MESTAAKALQDLESIQSSTEISIIKLSEQISSPQDDHPSTIRNRTSDASNLGSSLDDDAPTPASLDADLAHYKELFAKLRFSYVEQVTKEKFIRAIVGDPPLIVTIQENLDLEKQNAAAKSELKALKLHVADTLSDLESTARSLSHRHEAIQLQTSKLRSLPSQNLLLQESIHQLKISQELPPGTHPTQNLPLGKTRDLVSRRKREQQDLARELEALQAKAPRKRKEADRLRTELQPLEMKRQNSMVAAREAERRREAALGGVADDLEQRARWWRASEGVLKHVLDLKN